MNEESFESKFYHLDLVEVRYGKKKYAVKDLEMVSQEEDKTQNFIGELLIKFSNANQYFGNNMGSVHGGAIATWVDIVTSQAVLAFDT